MVPKYIKENANDVVFEMEYNAERPHLIIPEYGRHLQKLIDQATDIVDDVERNKAAKYIIQVMGSLNPHLRDVLDFQHKLWDQLFVMSDFRLVADSPYPIPTRDEISKKPDLLAYPQKFPKYRFYGNNITYMINVANGWNEGDMKDALVIVIANHMKKSYLSWNKDDVEDWVIFDHLYELSNGKLNLKQSNEALLNANELNKTNKKVSNKSFLNTQKNVKIQPVKKVNSGKKPFVKK